MIKPLVPATRRPICPYCDNDDRTQIEEGAGTATCREFVCVCCAREWRMRRADRSVEPKEST